MSSKNKEFGLSSIIIASFAVPLALCIVACLFMGGDDWQPTLLFKVVTFVICIGVSITVSKIVLRPLHCLLKYVQMLRTGSNKASKPPKCIIKEINQLSDMVEESLGEMFSREKKLEVTLNSIGDGVIATDTEGKVTIMNPVSEKLTGYSLSEAVGRPLSEIFQIYNANTGKPEFNPVKKVLSTGQVIGLANHTVLVSKNNQKYQIADSAAPILDQNGNTLGVIMVFSDVTKEYEMREEIRQSEETFSSIIKSSPMGIYIYTRDKNDNLIFTNSNDAADRLIGKSHTDIIGKSVIEAFPMLERTPAPEMFLRAAKEGKSWYCASMDYDDGNISGAFEVSAFRFAPDRVAVMFNDITEKKKMEQKLQTIQKLESLELLAGGIAHDFNNILTGIYGSIESIRLSLSEGRGVQQHIETSLKSVSRATGLTRQLMTFAKGGNPEMQSVDLCKIIEESVAFDLSGSNVKAKIKADNKLLPVRADKNQIEQVIGNLVINARQAMDNGGELIVKMDNTEFEGKKYVEIRVHDTGPGMSKTIVERIFDPYFTTKANGSGLGLSIAHSIISKHEGHITVQSTIGEGSEFKILLPAVTSESDLKHVQVNNCKGSLENIRVLIMDDEDIVRQITCQMLESFGCRVTEVDCGEKMLKAYEEALNHQRRFDVVLTDLTIPGRMGGQEAVKRLHKIDPRAVVIVCSGYENHPAITDHRQYGFTESLTKPFSIEGLRNILIKALNK